MGSLLDRQALPSRAMAAAALVAALLAGYLVPTVPALAVLIVAGAVGVLLVLNPRIAFLLGLLFLPFGRSLTGSGGGLQISLSDALFGIVFGALVVAAVVGRSTVDWGGFWHRAVRWGLPYAGAIVVGLAAAPEQDSMINALQRFQLILIPLALGYLLMTTPERRDRALRCYLLAALVLALAWIGIAGPFGANSVLGVNKNPSGQFLANGLLLVLAVRSLRRFAVITVPVLSIGLLFTQSRGSLLGAVAGLLVVGLMATGVDRRRLIGVTLVAAVGVGFGYQALPDSAKQRTTRTSSEGDFAIGTREAYREDALLVIRENPFLGVGIGNYRSGSRDDLTFTTDPHNVVLLTAAENGLPGLLGFVVLVTGTSVAVLRRRKVNVLVPAALAVQASGLVHGLVDVYWVRGTPTLGWLLVGAALAPVLSRTTADDEPVAADVAPLPGRVGAA